MDVTYQYTQPTCFMDKIGDIGHHAESAVDNFKKRGFTDIVSGMKEVSIMLDMIRQSENDCYR